SASGSSSVHAFANAEAVAPGEPGVSSTEGAASCSSPPPESRQFAPEYAPPSTSPMNAARRNTDRTPILHRFGHPAMAIVAALAAFAAFLSVACGNDG